MLIRKKLAILTLVACIATTGTGCGLFVRDSELQKNIYGVTSVNNVNATENNCYYVAKNDGTFQKLYMGRATFYNGKNSSNSARVAWFGRDYDRIPTMYRGEKIVFRSDAEFDELFVLERFEDLGHTIGHAIEKYKDFTMAHGLCVAVGTVAAAAISAARGILPEEEFMRVREANRVFGLPTQADEIDEETILTITKSDKKMAAGRIRFILFDRIGHAFIADDVTDEELLEGIKSVNGVRA